MKTRNTFFLGGLLALTGSLALGQQFEAPSGTVFVSEDETEDLVGTLAGKKAVPAERLKDSDITVSPISIDARVTPGEQSRPIPASERLSEPVHVLIRVYQLDPNIADNFDSWLSEIEKSAQLSKPATPAERFGYVVRSIENVWKPEGKAKLVGQPVVVAPAGFWASLDIAKELTYPAEYDPATVPKAQLDKVHGGGFLDNDGQQKLKTNDSAVPTPPHPSDFESQDLGLMMKVRPQIEGRGNVSVDFRVEQSVLAGFINYGTPITLDKPGALRKNAKPIKWLENQILMPVILKHRENFKVSSGGDSFYLINPDKTKDTESPKPEYSDFGAEFSEPGLPPLLFLVSAGKLNPGLKSLTATDSGTAPAKTQSWPLTQQVRQSFGLKGEQPGPVASREFTERLVEFGIRVRNLKIDPEWNLEARATPEMIERISGLLPVYEANPQIFISSKVVETNAPLDPLGKPIMNDAELQTFVREISQKKGIDLLSAPSIMVRPLQEGKVEVVREFIYPTGYDPPEVRPAKTDEESSSGVTPSTPREFKTRNIGVELALKPRLIEDGSIELEMSQEVSESLGFLNFGQPINVLHKGPLGKHQIVEISENQILLPVFGRRSIDTRVRIPDGSSILVGGLVKTDVQDVEEKVPFLGDLPIIGRLARSNTEIEISRYVYFIVTAKVHQGPSVTKAK